MRAYVELIFALMILAIGYFLGQLEQPYKIDSKNIHPHAHLACNDGEIGCEYYTHEYRRFCTKTVYLD